MAALILPESLKLSGGGNVGRVRSGLTRQATDAMANAAEGLTLRLQQHLLCGQVGQRKRMIALISHCEARKCTRWFAVQVARCWGVMGKTRKCPHCGNIKLVMMFKLFL